MSFSVIRALHCVTGSHNGLKFSQPPRVKMMLCQDGKSPVLSNTGQIKLLANLRGKLFSMLNLYFHWVLAAHEVVGSQNSTSIAPVLKTEKVT